MRSISSINSVSYKSNNSNEYQISDEFKKYIKSHCKNITEPEVIDLLKKNKELLEHLKNRSENLIPDNRKIEYLVAFVWGLMEKAIEKGEAFIHGTFKFEDPGHRIVEFFRTVPGIYTRPSSHFKERVLMKGRFSSIFNAYAIDDDRFPAEHRTAIFAPIRTLNEVNYSFIKSEEHSASPWRPLEFLKHTWDYFYTRPRAWGWVTADTSYREEDTPKHLIHRFKELVKMIPKIDQKQRIISKVYSYGISGIWEEVQRIYAIAQITIQHSPTPFWQTIFRCAGELKADLENKYSHLGIRKGNEVIITDLLN